MTYFTIKIEIEEDLTPSEILQVMKDGATHWSKCFGKPAKTRFQIKNKGTQYYMRVGYAS